MFWAYEIKFGVFFPKLLQCTLQIHFALVRFVLKKGQNRSK